MTKGAEEQQEDFLRMPYRVQLLDVAEHITKVVMLFAKHEDLPLARKQLVEFHAVLLDFMVEMIKETEEELEKTKQQMGLDL